MKTKAIFLCLMIFIIIVSCTHESGQTVSVYDSGNSNAFIIHTDKIQDSLNLELSDFAWNYEIVPLETNEDCLITYEKKYFVGKEFFIIQRRSGELLQFDRQGNYIRKIVNKGRGPLEISTGVWDVDDINQILYVSQTSIADYFLHFDLYTGQFLGEIKKAIAGKTHDLKCTADGSLLVVPTQDNNKFDSTALVYWQDTTGLLICSIPLQNHHSSLWNQVNLSFTDNIYRLRIFDLDTIYSICQNKIEPYLVFDYGKPNPPGRATIGHYHLTIDKEVEGWSTIHLGEVSKVKGDKSGLSSYSSKMRQIIFDKMNQKAYFKGRLYIDITDDKNGFFITFCDNGNFVKPYEASDFIRLSSNAIKNNELDSIYRSKLISALSHLSPEDNPVMLIGQYR